MSRVPVIIPFYREREKLERCLAHLRAQTHANLDIFVRDNTHENIQFTAAVNEGLRKFCYDPAIEHVAVLNQDAYLAPDAVQKLVEFLQSNRQAGVACPLQVDGEGRVTWGGSLQAFPFGVHRCDPLASYHAPVETPWGNGAALLIRTEVVREVGLFDRNMRFICSDADFTFAARARGWKIYVVPSARCTHTLSGSAGHDPQLDVLKLRDALYFAKKWVSGELYQSLAHEGPSLTRTGIRLEISRLERALEQLERRTGAATQSGTLA